MNKIIKIFLVLFIVFIFTNVTSVGANDSSDGVEFDDFVYVSKKIRENNTIKVCYQISFEASQPIVVEKITYEIKSQYGYVPNSNKIIGKSQKYDFIVEDWQTGTLELVIEYMIAEEEGIPPFNSGQTYTKTIYLVDNGAWKEEIDWSKAIILGLFTTICVVAATSIIISSSKKESLIKELEEE